MRKLLINWIDQIKSFQKTETDKGAIIRSLKQDLDTIEPVLLTGEKVILIFAKGTRHEIYPLFENGELDIRNITNDFTAIYEFNVLKNRILEKVNYLREQLKNNPDLLADTEELIKLKLSPPLFSIDLYKNNKIYKSYKRISCDYIEIYIYGVLDSFGIVLDSKYEGICQ
jgi:hypothetical protein